MSNEIELLNERAIKKAVTAVRQTYNEDKMIMQAVQALGETEQSNNITYERLREMYWRYLPEALEKINTPKQLVKTVNSDKKELMKEVGISESMGYDLRDDELIMMKEFASGLNDSVSSQGKLEEFIKRKMQAMAPEASKIATPLLTGRLMTIAGGFREMAYMPASTIQLLGAEKALFRHLRSNAMPPKHGIILQHQDVQSAKKKGKAARQLANKIAIAIRQDYFKGGRK